MGCEHIKDKGKYYTSTRPEGDNKSSIVVYKDTLVSNCYTIGLEKVDIITLVEKLKNIYFTHALKWISDVCGYDYYELEKPEQNELLDWLDNIEGKIYQNDEEIYIKPLSENILKEYFQYPNKLFLDEGINLITQKEFEIGFDINSERITMPIRDEIGTLIGIMGRATNQEDEKEYKYLPLYVYPKSKILYGLYKTLPYIKKRKECIIFEGQKSVMKSWQYGYKNCVAIGQLIPTESQMEKLLKLNCDLVFAWDNGLKKEQTDMIEDFLNNYKIYTNIYIIFDKWELTDFDKKDSPVDKGMEIFQELYNKKFKFN